MGCNCGGGKKAVSVAVPSKRTTISGEAWEAVLPDGSVVEKPTKRQAEAIVAMRGGRVRRVTKKAEGS